MAEKLIRRAILTAAILLVIALGLRFGSGTRESALGAASPAPAHAPSPARSEAMPAPARISSRSASWSAFSPKLKDLRGVDQKTLDDLYRSARELILSNEKTILSEIFARMPALLDADLEESFFTMSAWIRSSRQPSATLEALWQVPRPADAPDRDSHHVALTPSVKYERIEAYAIREIRKGIESGDVTLEGPSAAPFVSKLAVRARDARSLDLSLEAFQLLSLLHQPRAIKQALEGHNERDQKLILAVLKRTEQRS